MTPVLRVLIVAAVLALGACADAEYESGARYVPYDTPTGDPSFPYPEWNGYDLDCSDVAVPVVVDGDDPHELDGDGNGIGCE